MTNPDLMTMFKPMLKMVVIGLTSLWPLLLALVVVCVVLAYLKSRRFKGKLGEHFVSKRLRDGLDSRAYTILDDIYLPLDNGTTTQIDHIVVSRYGVFVIETKNYTGWIFADARSRVWTQSVHRKKSTFQNPIRQNYLHICSISTCLGVPKEMLFGVVVFTGDCTFKTEMPAGVVYSRKASEYIQSFTEPVLKDAEVADIVTAIRDWNESVTREQRRAHVANLRARHEWGNRRVSGGVGD